MLEQERAAAEKKAQETQWANERQQRQAIEKRQENELKQAQDDIAQWKQGIGSEGSPKLPGTISEASSAPRPPCFRKTKKMDEDSDDDEDCAASGLPRAQEETREQLLRLHAQPTLPRPQQDGQRFDNMQCDDDDDDEEEEEEEPKIREIDSDEDEEGDSEDGDERHASGAKVRKFPCVSPCP